MKKKESIRVGDYDVFVQKSRVVVQNPPFVGASGVAYEAETEVVIPKTLANRILSLPAEIKVNQASLAKLYRERKALAKKQNEIFKKIDAIDCKVDDIENDMDYGIIVPGYDISYRGGSLVFGCTTVEPAQLKAIRKLIQ